jgi:hypothetical protein
MVARIHTAGCQGDWQYIHNPLSETDGLSDVAAELWGGLAAAAQDHGHARPGVQVRAATPTLQH